MKKDGIDAHKVKRDWLGEKSKDISKYNISKDDKENIILTPVKKDSILKEIPIGLKYDELKILYPID